MTTPENAGPEESLRITLELVGGVVFGFGGFFLGTIPGWQLGLGGPNSDRVALTGGLIGASALFPAGIYLGGNLVNGRGSLLWTYVGGLTGAGAALAIGAFLLPSSFTGTILIPIPLIGGELGYEISHRLAPRSSEKSGDATN